MERGGSQLDPPLVEDEYRTVSAFSVRPSTQLMAIRFVAPAPVGAPLAMSTEGAGERSRRPPPTPSSTQRPIDGSMRLQVSYAVNTARGRVNVRPPSNDLIIWICPGAAPVG